MGLGVWAEAGDSNSITTAFTLNLTLSNASCKFLGVINPDLLSTSVKKTGASHIFAALAVAKKVIGVVIIPFLLLSPMDLYTECRAAVPELQMIAFETSSFFFNF